MFTITASHVSYEEMEEMSPEQGDTSEHLVAACRTSARSLAKYMAEQIAETHGGLDGAHKLEALRFNVACVGVAPDVKPGDPMALHEVPQLSVNVYLAIGEAP